MIADTDLLAAVDVAFAITGRAHPPWPNPHPEGNVSNDEYSRVTNPGKWRIVGARADAWAVALTELGLATAEPNAEVVWGAPAGTCISRVDRLVPRVRGALPLVLARSSIEDVDDAGVTLGVGEPAVCLTWIPGCGCDACDSGSTAELEVLDEHMLSVVSGRLRLLRAGEREITVIREGQWSASGLSGRRVRAALADPSGWDELSGASWLDNTRGADTEDAAGDDPDANGGSTSQGRERPSPGT